MRTIFKILVLLTIISSCDLIKPNNKTVYVIKDSVIIKKETVYQDTIITIPGDTIRFQVPCDKDTIFIVKSNSSSSIVQIKDGIVNVQNNCNEKDIIITKLNTRIENLQKQINNTTTTKIVKERYVPKIYKFFTWGFWILLLLLIVSFSLRTNTPTMVFSQILSLFNNILKRKKD